MLHKTIYNKIAWNYNNELNKQNNYVTLHNSRITKFNTNSCFLRNYKMFYYFTVECGSICSQLLYITIKITIFMHSAYYKTVQIYLF